MSSRAAIAAEPFVGLAGDWHGDSAWAGWAIEAFAAEGLRTVHHLGDFGFWTGARGQAYLAAVDQACATTGITLTVTPGNHEDYGLIAGLAWGTHPSLARVQLVTDRLVVLPRGHRWRTTGSNLVRSFVSLGGAPSVDLEGRIPGVSWWAQEAITDVDVELTAAGGHADVMLTHDSPSPGTPAVEAIIAGNPMGWSPNALEYAAAGRGRLTTAYEAVRPTLLVHGHYPVRDEVRLEHPSGAAAHIVSLDCERTAGNLAVLDVDALEVRFLDA